MTGASVAGEVAAALREATAEVGSGEPNIVTLLKAFPAQQNPWDPPADSGEEHRLVALADSFSRAHVDGTLIRADDLLLMLEASGPVPTQADKIRIDGQDYAIVTVRPEAPGGVPLYFEVQCRK